MTDADTIDKDGKVMFTQGSKHLVELRKLADECDPKYGKY